MVRRRRLLAILLLAAALHGFGIARTILPAQDGLKFLRIARQFQHEPALDVIRGSDRHPLYPALIALVEPLVASCAGPGPDTWRITAQVVSAIASMALIVPLYGLARGLFGDRIATLSALLLVVLPLPAEVGRDTLADSLALLATLGSLYLGAKALENGSRGAFAGCGLAAGIGYLARPEVALVPPVVALALLLKGGWRPTLRSRAVVGLSTLGVAFLTLMGAYAMAKGEVSEKLALRYGAGLAPSRPAPGKARPRPWLPPGLDDPRWDFSPKEEAMPDEGVAEGRPRLAAAIGQVIMRWAEGLGWFFGLLALWGAFRAAAARDLIAADESAERRGSAFSSVAPRLRTLLVLYLVLYAAIAVRHLVLLGYLSDRHVLPIVVVALPWSAAGTYLVARRAADLLGWAAGRRRRVAALLLGAVVLVALALPHWKPGHRSRWGYWAAGHWLRAHARDSDKVLDTRGWAAFVSGRPGYDYWHVRQALTDPHLSYLVVGEDERLAPSRRGATLRALLAYAAVPVAAFPDDQRGTAVAVWVYRYQRPDSWEGLRP